MQEEEANIKDNSSNSHSEAIKSMPQFKDRLAKYSLHMDLTKKVFSIPSTAILVLTDTLVYGPL